MGQNPGQLDLAARLDAVQHLPIIRTLVRIARRLQNLRHAAIVHYFNTDPFGVWVRDHIPANVLSLSRIPMAVPVFLLIGNGHPMYALIVYAIGEFTDSVDGPLADAQYTAGKLGMLIESSADFVLQVSTLVAIWQYSHDPVLLPVMWLEVTRIVLTLVGMTAISLPKLNVTLLGRIKAVAYFLATTSFLLGFKRSAVALFKIGIGFCVLSLLIQIVGATRHFSQRHRS